MKKIHALFAFVIFISSCAAPGYVSSDGSGVENDPFSTIVTRDVLATKKKEELDVAESRNRVQKQAVLLTINEIGNKVTEFLKGE